MRKPIHMLAVALLALFPAARLRAQEPMTPEKMAEMVAKSVVKAGEMRLEAVKVRLDIEERDRRKKLFPNDPQLYERAASFIRYYDNYLEKVKLQQAVRYWQEINPDNLARYADPADPESFVSRYASRLSLHYPPKDPAAAADSRDKPNGLARLAAIDVREEVGPFLSRYLKRYKTARFMPELVRDIAAYRRNLEPAAGVNRHLTWLRDRLARGRDQVRSLGGDADPLTELIRGVNEEINKLIAAANPAETAVRPLTDVAPYFAQVEAQVAAIEPWDGLQSEYTRALDALDRRYQDAVKAMRALEAEAKRGGYLIPNPLTVVLAIDAQNAAAEQTRPRRP